ncbi:hypothetical protein VM1G_00780 [Cytospora mali]|uniref:Uncharacterized protein n=1 Tax=Cytospora mali TaxID=578113 RepID=A0A194VMA4_CYTMA|nr:hypothetical protein VM1G_00780 [Valsa mali]
MKDFSSSNSLKAFAQPRATMNHLLPRAMRSQEYKKWDVQGLRADVEGRDRDAKPSSFARLESKLGDIYTSLKKRKSERNCLRKTKPRDGEPSQHVDAEKFITQSRTIEYRDIDLGARVRVNTIEPQVDQEDDGHLVADYTTRHQITFLSNGHSQAQDIFTGTAIESGEAYKRIMHALGGDEAIYPSPPTRPPPAVPTYIGSADHRVLATDTLDRDRRPQTRSTQRSSSDESLRLLKTRSTQSGAGGHSRSLSNDTTATSLYSIEECTECPDTSGVEKAIGGGNKTSHQSGTAGQRDDADSGWSQDYLGIALKGNARDVDGPLLSNHTSRRQNECPLVRVDNEATTTGSITPWQRKTEWHDPNLPELRTPESSSDESMDGSPTPSIGGRGLPVRMQEEIKESLTLVNSLMSYKLEDDPEMIEALNGRLGAATDPKQYLRTEGRKRFADINVLKGTLTPKKDTAFELFVNHDVEDGDLDGDIPASVPPTGQTSSSLAQPFEPSCDDVFESDIEPPWRLEPADILRYYQEDPSEESDWDLDDEIGSPIQSPSQQAFDSDSCPSGSWTPQLCQIDEESSEECDSEFSTHMDVADELRSLIKFEGSLDAIKSHVDKYVNEVDFSVSINTGRTPSGCLAKIHYDEVSDGDEVHELR